MTDFDDIREFDYELPEELIARQPLERRDASRLLVVHRASGKIEHRSISDLPEYLNIGDVLVANNSKVVPARLLGQRAQTGGKWEGLYLGLTEDGDWQLIGQTRGKLQPGEIIAIHPAHEDRGSRNELPLRLIERSEEGSWIARPEIEGGHLELLAEFGTVPLPPYIQRVLATSDDWDRYQTVYAERPGSVAAPTAGLHFTDELLAECEAKGVSRESVTLHVGVGTFRPVSTERLSEHHMHSEWCELDEATCGRILSAKDSGRRVVSIGTTTTRTLESAARSGRLQPWSAATDLFIRPGFEFHCVDALLTNFHLPKSTLLVLVSAFAGIDLIREAYSAAVNERYRFFSYGDAMLLI